MKPVDPTRCPRDNEDRLPSTDPPQMSRTITLFSSRFFFSAAFPAFLLSRRQDPEEIGDRANSARRKKLLRLLYFTGVSVPFSTRSVHGSVNFTAVPLCTLSIETRGPAGSFNGYRFPGAVPLYAKEKKSEHVHRNLPPFLARSNGARQTNARETRPSRSVESAIT